MKIAIEIDNNRITIPDGCSVRQEGNVIYFEPKEEKEGEVKCWKDFKGWDLEGYVFTADSGIKDVCWINVGDGPIDVARTEAHCRAMLAMAMISQLKPYYGGDITEEERNNMDLSKYGIYWSANRKGFCVGVYQEVLSTLLTFHSKEQAEEFIENNRDLLLDYFMIDKEEE